MTTPIEVCLRVHEVAARLRLSVPRIRQLIRSGRLRAIDVGRSGRHQLRIQPAALAAFEESLVLKTGPAPRRKVNRIDPEVAKFMR